MQGTYMFIQVSLQGQNHGNRVLETNKKKTKEKVKTNQADMMTRSSAPPAPLPPEVTPGGHCTSLVQ